MSRRAAFLLVLVFTAFRPHAAFAQGACTLFAAQGGNPGVNGNTTETDLFLLNPLTGAINALVGSLGMPITGLARHPFTGEIFGATTAEGAGVRHLVRINPATGAANVIAPFVAAHQPPRIADLAFGADGTLYGWNEEGDDLVTVNLTTGESTLVGNAGISALGGSIALSPGGTLFVAPVTAGATALRTVDPTTGLTTPVAILTATPLPATEPMSALTFSPAGTLFGLNLRTNVPRDSFLVSIDTATGVVTSRGPISTPRLDAIEHICLPAFDFDGDLQANFGVFRSTRAEWFVSGSSGPMQFGAVGDTPLPADYDGDGLSDLAVFRPNSGEWFISGSNIGFTTFVFGAAVSTGLGDTPVPADYDGDGKVDVAIYRASEGTWFILGSTSGFQAITFGAAAASGLGDRAVPADYDGDGKADIAIYRETEGTWFFLGSAMGFHTLAFGASSTTQLGDTPVPTDYDGDGKADVAVFRKATGEWFILRSRAGFQTLVFGAATITGLGDTPVPTDYDGDGKADVAVYRAASGQWFYMGSRVGFRTSAFGAAAVSGLGDVPLNRPATLR